LDYIEVISRLGVGSAHPGGFQASVKFLEHLNAVDHPRVLEVGCGTGKSACYLAKKGFNVTALEKNTTMLEKAKKRAEKEGIGTISWIEGDTRALPFDNESFDVVFAESVTIFTDIEKSINEYYRVLKNGGQLLDLELILVEKLPEAIHRQMMDFFKMEKFLTVEEWLSRLENAGFKCAPPEIEDFLKSAEPSVADDMLQELDFSMLMDPEVSQGIIRYGQLMLDQQSFFRACTFRATKA